MYFFGKNDKKENNNDNDHDGNDDDHGKIIAC